MLVIIVWGDSCRMFLKTLYSIFINTKYSCKLLPRDRPHSYTTCRTEILKIYSTIKARKWKQWLQRAKVLKTIILQTTLTAPTCDDSWGLSCHDGLWELGHAQARPGCHRPQNRGSRYRFLEEQSGTYRNTAWTAPVKRTHNTNTKTNMSRDRPEDKTNRPSHTQTSLGPAA